MHAETLLTEDILVLNSDQGDIDVIFRLFDSAIAYQQKKGYDLWPQFSRELILTEMQENRHWKMVKDGTIICIFSVLYSDPVIWTDRNLDAIYLHRIAVNPDFKGRYIMKVIKQWAEEHARKKGLAYVRMDTWGNNETLRAYYINCGFTYIGQQYLNNIDGLPMHYGGSVLSLFEVEVCL